jgi:protocatechuate 3,4-dioxygenase alpha subunit
MLLWGYVYDGLGDSVPDAHLEIWHADEKGRVPREQGSLKRDGFTFSGYGRTTTDETGRYWFSTLNPGPVVWPKKGTPAAFISMGVFARGLLDRHLTRIYLPESPLAEDPLLSSVTEAERASLIGLRQPDGSLRFDIHLQGDQETLFLNLGHR